MKLTQLNKGESATIIRIGKVGELKKRLIEMGITNGELIKLERNAPLGDPQQYIIKESGVAIRKEDADHIEIENIVSCSKKKKFY